jgi:hypothetical protein
MLCLMLRLDANALMPNLMHRIDANQLCLDATALMPNLMLCLASTH